MTKTFALALTLALVVSSGAFAKDKPCHDEKGHFAKCPPPAGMMTKAPNCKVGKPCGKSCIAKDKVCHIK